MAYRRKNPWVDYVTPDLSHRHAPDLVPVFGVKTFDATTTCKDIHPHGPIPSGSRCICMGPCHKSGVDALVRDHTKPGNGQLREGWDMPEPTKYLPAETVAPSTGKRLRGGIGR
jgi:hypothetical protein